MEKSHPSFKRAKYVLRLLSAKCNTTSAWRLCSNETSAKGLSLQFLGMVCALFISRLLCQAVQKTLFPVFFFITVALESVY